MTAALQPGGGQTPTDAELAIAAAHGDRHAFGQIYDRYADRLLDFSTGMLRDRDAAADCVHDAFCTAAGALGGLRDPERLRPWLYAIVRSQVLHHIRDHRRETPVAEHFETPSDEPGPETYASRGELAALVAEAAGGLSERDQLVLELVYRHGLDGPELVEVLGVSQSNANTMVYRLRETVQRALGALLVARRANGSRESCPELSAILAGWDGTFTVLMRKRIGRHIDSCETCDDERRALVTPAALLGSAPVFVAAPPWLRESTMTDIELVSRGSALTSDPASAGRDRSNWLPATAVALAAVAVLGLSALYLTQRADDVEPTDHTTTSTAPVAPVSAPTSAPTPMTPRSQPAQPPPAPTTAPPPAPTAPSPPTPPTSNTPATTPEGVPAPPPAVSEPVPEPSPPLPEFTPPTWPPTSPPWTGPTPAPPPDRVPGASDPTPARPGGQTGLAPIPATPVIPTPVPVP